MAFNAPHFAAAPTVPASTHTGDWTTCLCPICHQMRVSQQTLAIRASAKDRIRLLKRLIKES